MPTLTKQSIINLLIDSPLREPIKINLVDIVNNTKDADLPKVFPTINKELEIFQKATTRRLKLADDTIKKLSTAPAEPTPTSPTSPAPTPTPKPLPTAPTELTAPTESTSLKVPPLKLPPLPQPKTDSPSLPPLPPLPTSTPKPLPSLPTAPTKSTEPTAKTESTEQADEAALKEIQKELDSLKNDALADQPTQPNTPTPPPTIN